MSELAPDDRTLQAGLPSLERQQPALRPLTGLAELQRYGVSDLPLMTTQPRRSPPLLFTVVVLAPMLLGAIYNFAIASDRYASTASFVIRETQRDGMVSLSGSGGMTRSDDDSYAVAEYIASRDAVDRLSATTSLEAMFASPGIDYFSRFPTKLAGHSREDLYRHFQHYVDVDFNASTGISTLSVQAFTPLDAKQLTEELLRGAEGLVNALDTRARDDSVAFASSLVEEADKRLAEAQANMTAFRNAEQILNPDSEVTISNALLTEMMRSLGDTDAQISQMTASAPDNPRLAQLKTRRDALLKNIEAQRATMVGNNGSLALKIEGYEKVRLERDLAEKSLINAVNALDVARQESQQGHLYLERVVEPSLPDRYGYPTRFWNMLLLAGIFLSGFWIIRKTTDILSENRH